MVRLPHSARKDLELNARRCRTRLSPLPVAGLLVLAAICFDVRPALAQARLDCPLPAGVTAPEPPRVTAQQVEDGSAALRDFALAARERFVSVSRGITSAGQTAYFGCLVRQEGSPWRSGSTYLVQLTIDGRVFFHAKDMSLSGRQLHPLIYGAILQALGIDPAALRDPAAAAAAFAAAIAGDGGPFNVAPVPGASGYATVYPSATIGQPLVLLAGFDLGASHLAEETIQHLNPTVTARDVVDRASLKAFVTAAGDYFIELVETGDPAALSKARVAFRDPNGPWVHGSVYIAAMQPDTRLIVFHGGFPDRFELRQGGISRDAVTGELIVDQLIAAANSGPEGGFWQYHFDNPADDTDSAEIPKVGYARLFSGNIPLPDGRMLPTSFIVNSGFYLSSPEVIAARHNAVVESVLPRVMRAMTASTVDAISGRVRQASTGTPPPKGFSLGGASTLSDALLAHGQSLQNGTVDVARLLADSSFTLPLNAAAGGGESGPFGELTLWGSGDYRNFSGGNRQSVGYDGDVASAHVGIDTRLSPHLLAGVSVARSQGTVDYTDSYALTGELTTDLTSVNPYVGWQGTRGMSLWATAGHGWGEVEIEDASVDTQASDLTQQMFAVGVDGPLVSSDDVLEGGTTSLRLKAETALTRAEIEGAGTLESTKLSASRQRLVLEGLHVRKRSSGATFTPSLALGMRHDGGDGETGTSLEVGGGVRFADPATGLSVEGRARTLLAGGGDYEEWGVSGRLQIDPGATGRGLALSVRPAWGQTASGVQGLWQNDVIGGAAPANQSAGHVNAEIGYGLGAGPGLGVVTPYARLGLGSEGARSWGMGAHWQVAPDASLSLEGTRHEAADDGPEHGLMLRGALRW